MSWQQRRGRASNAEDVPEHVLDALAQKCAILMECRECECEFWTYFIHGHNREADCTECGETHRIVG